MSEHNYSYTDERLDPNEADNYDLLLQADVHGFSYAIVKDRRLLAWAENCPLDELSQPHALRDVLTANYKQVITGLSSGSFTLVPNDLFDDEYSANIARMLDVSESDQVFAQPFDSRNTIVYKTNIALDATTHFNGHSRVHRAKGWVAAIAANYPTSTDIFLNIENDQLEVLNYNYGRIRLYNTFSYKGHEELAYFTAFAVQELKLQPADVTVILSGDIKDTDKSFTYLTDFFGKVRLNDTKVLLLPDTVAPHQVLSLTALSLCASSEGN